MAENADRLPPRVDEDGLVAFLDEQPDVVAVYLFGSHAEGRAHPDSDVDLAVQLRASDDAEVFDRRLRLMDEFDAFVEGDVDVVVVNTAPPLLQHQVLKRGRLIYERDRAARVEFAVRAMQRYADLKPMYAYFTKSVLEEIKEGGLGERRRNRRRTPRSSTQ